MVKDPRLPNFFILGAAKCGTSSLYYYLEQHPQIYLPKNKEPHFFDNDTFWNEGFETYLKRHFKGAEGYPARGDATPRYFHWPEKVIPRMLEVYPPDFPKFILVFRDPVERAWSHYLHRLRNKIETETFERALELETTRLAEDRWQWVGYFSDGLYAKQLKKWLAHFPKSNFLFLLNEDLREEPMEAVKRAFRFLSVDETVEVDVTGKWNVAAAPRFPWLMRFVTGRSPVKRPIGRLLSPYQKRRIKEWLVFKNLRPLKEKPKMDPGIAAKLREAYREDIVELSQLIGRDLSHWLGRS